MILWIEKFESSTFGFRLWWNDPGESIGSQRPAFVLFLLESTIWRSRGSDCQSHLFRFDNSFLRTFCFCFFFPFSFSRTIGRTFIIIILFLGSSLHNGFTNPLRREVTQRGWNQQAERINLSSGLLYEMDLFEERCFEGTLETKQTQITSSLVTTICKNQSIIDIESIALRKKPLLHWSGLELKVHSSMELGWNAARRREVERRGEERTEWVRTRSLLLPFNFFQSVSMNLFTEIELDRRLVEVSVSREDASTPSLSSSPSPSNSSQNLLTLLYSLRKMHQIKILTNCFLISHQLPFAGSTSSLSCSLSSTTTPYLISSCSLRPRIPSLKLRCFASQDKFIFEWTRLRYGLKLSMRCDVDDRLAGVRVVLWKDDGLDSRGSHLDSLKSTWWSG